MSLRKYYVSQLTDKRISEFVTDKRLSSESILDYMLIRLNKMFKYDNLPETIPQEILETYLLQNGTAYITKVKEELYVFIGTMGGEPDAYYRPTKYIIANPGLNYNATLDLWSDGVLMRNDTMWLGLVPLMSQYATLMTENLITLRSADVMLRAVAMITAPDDASKLSAEIYLKKLEQGEFGVIGDNPFFDGVKMQSPPSNNGSYLTQFIELHQYLKASFYNEIGLDANYNMKREAIMQGESMLNKDILLPLCENMLKCRKDDILKVNEMFGTNISVDFDSSWKQNQKEVDLQLKGMVSQLTGEHNENSETCDERVGQSIDEGSGINDRCSSNISNGPDIDSNGLDVNGQNDDSISDTAGNTGNECSNAESESNQSGTSENSTTGDEGRVQVKIINISQLIKEGEENGGTDNDRAGDSTDIGNTDNGTDG